MSFSFEFVGERGAVSQKVIQEIKKNLTAPELDTYTNRTINNLFNGIAGMADLSVSKNPDGSDKYVYVKANGHVSVDGHNYLQLELRVMNAVVPVVPEGYPKGTSEPV